MGDKRTDSGQFYPGGKVIPRQPVRPGGGSDADAVHYYAETKTDAQKEQARQNIGAMAADTPIPPEVTLETTAPTTKPTEDGHGLTKLGIWSAIWGALTALPTGFSSLYDWCAAKFSKKRDKTDLGVFEMKWSRPPMDGREYRGVTLHYEDQPTVRYGEEEGIYYYTWAELTEAYDVFATTSEEKPESLDFSYSFAHPDLSFKSSRVQYETSDHLAKVSQLPTAAEKAAWNAKQSKITASGILNGDGQGGVRAAIGGEDYVRPGELGASDITIDGTTLLTTIFDIFTSLTNLQDGKANVSDIIDPALAAAVGKIADAKLTRDFVNLMVSTNSAHYLTARAGTAGAYTYPPFASASALRAALAAHTEQDPQFFYAGEAFTPTKNDWVIVSADEDHPLGTIIPASRYGFVGTFGSGGSFQYQVSYKLPLTTAQIAALDSGATATRLSGLESDGTATEDFATDLLGKQVAISAIDARLPYPLNMAGTILDRHINDVTSGEFVIPEGFHDLLIRYTGVPASLTFSGTDASIADYGDDLPTETGDYLVTVTRTKAAECYIRIVTLEARA